MLEFFIKYRGYFVIFGGFLVQFALGSFYTYGNIQPYLVLYMRNISISRNNVNMGNSVWIYGLLAFGMGTAVSLGDYISNRIGPILTVLLGGWFYCLNVCLTSLTIKTYLTVVIISDGLLAGMGIGLAYGVALATPIKWFPNRKGLFLGIIVSGFGLSATIFDFCQIMYIRRQLDNRIEFSEKIPESYYVLGLTYAALIGIGSIFLKNPPEKTEAGLEDDSFTQANQSTLNTFICNLSETNNRGVDFLPHQLLFELDFWILWLTFALNAASVVLLMSLYKGFGMVIKLSDKGPYHFLTVVSMVGAIFNGAGRIFWGMMYDKKSYKAIMLILTISITVLYPTFFICSAVGSVEGTDDSGRMVLYTIWVILLNFFMSGNFSIFPAICIQLFGMKHMVANYGLLFTSASLGGAVISVVTTTLWSNKKDVEKILYLHAFIAGGVMSLMAAGLTLLFRGRSLLVKIH